MSYLEKSRADRVALKQDGLLCFLLLLVASTILTICSLILAYRPYAFLRNDRSSSRRDDSYDNCIHQIRA